MMGSLGLSKERKNMVKRMLGLAVVLASVVSLLVSGCSVLQQAGSSGGGESYFPHAQGNSWRMTSTDGSSQIMTVEGTASVGSTTVQCFFPLIFHRRASVLQTNLIIGLIVREYICMDHRIISTRPAFLCFNFR